MKFVKENVNPKNRKTGDCVIRAIAKAEGKEWVEVFDSLVEIARKRCSVPNSPDAYEQYLKKYETVKVMYTREDGKKKRYLAGEVCGWDGVYVISLANHLTTVVDGALYDTWDCSQKSAYKIWKIR